MCYDYGDAYITVLFIWQVKDKTPAPVQITAEQLLREAKERELELVQAPPRQKISDAAELRDYQMRKRKVNKLQLRIKILTFIDFDVLRILNFPRNARHLVVVKFYLFIFDLVIGF